jgi:hypothetical protein
MIVDVHPTNPDAAAMRLRCADSKVILFFGQGAVFEVPQGGRRYTSLDLCGEVSALCEAVLQGAFEEMVYFRKEQVVGARALVLTADGTAHETWFSLRSILLRKEARHFRYLPYLPCKADVSGSRCEAHVPCQKM